MKRYNKRIVIIIAAVAGCLVFIEVALLLLLAAQNGRYHSYWQKRAEETSKNSDGLVYAALGDSVGIGIGASSAGKGYVGLIAGALEQKTGQPIQVINLSKSGATISECLDAQIPSLKALKPDFITIEIGANDMVYKWDETKFRDDMTRLVTELPKHTVISDMPYFGGGIKRKIENHIPRANQIIRGLAAEQGLRVASLHETTKANDRLLIYAADFFHPNNRGHQNWYKAFWEVLEKQSE